MPKINDLQNLLSEFENLKNAVDAQGKLIQENTASLKKVSRKLLWAQIFGWLKIVIILAPIILGVLYLRPFVLQVMSEFNSITQGLNPLSNLFFEGKESDGGAVTPGTKESVVIELPASFINSLPPDLQKIIKSAR